LYWHSYPEHSEKMLRSIWRQLMRLRYMRLFLLFCSALFLFGVSFSSKAQRKAPPDPARPKIRAITAFVNLDRAQYQQQIADAMAMLKRARTTFESRDYEVETIRISTQPFPEYTKGLTAEQALAFFKNYDALATEQKFAASIGPAMLNAGDPESQADLVVDILKNTKSINASLVVADENGVRWPSVGAAARTIQKLAATEHSQANFKFSAIAFVPPLTPFFPGSYHTGFGHQFAIALESANTVAAAFQGAPDLATARQRLIDRLGNEARNVEALAGRVDQDTGWTYMGIDLSPAPLKNISIAAALETLTAQPLGSPGTLTGAATITAAIRDIQVKQTGYNGLMLPVLEDSRIAQRWSEGRLSLDSLLSYSAVCGTGLDTVPLPGDVTEQQIELIIGDMASLAVKWHKPLSARLLPVTGKKPGDTTEFDDPYLVNATLQPIGGKNQ
jgi:uncharacterized protein (UPF0210 family)